MVSENSKFFINELIAFWWCPKELILKHKFYFVNLTSRRKKSLPIMGSATLMIKHLPSVLTDNEKEKLMKHFGAKEVRCITSQCNKYNLVFARFDNENIAQNVLLRLHQINVLGSTLSVEYAKSTVALQPQHQFSENDTHSDNENEKYYREFVKKLSAWHSGINFTQPVPSHLKYQYPPPDMQTLVNIMKVLVTVPKFYTQVLHLMNKMNLPCPFGRDILPDIELPIFSFNEERNTVSAEDEKKINEKSVESSESEISSDEELKKQKEMIPEQLKVKKKTKIKLPKFFKPAFGPPERPTAKRKTVFEEVFEKVQEEKEPKRIKLSQPPPPPLPPQETTTPSDKPESSVSGFGFIHPVKKPVENYLPQDTRDEREEERLEKEEIICISEAELAENRISEKDRSVLPVFKNYAEGAPTCRLYIKNLAKTVVEQDLRHIYNRYIPRNTGDKPNMFDIRLMQEGRMKGQAFVTLQTVDLAQKALKETNGYILKDKPLVVQFARSATK